MSIGEIIIKKRGEMNMTLDDLASKIKLSKSALSDIERYSRMPRFDDMCSICEILNLDIKEIWKEIRLNYLDPKAYRI